MQLKIVHQYFNFQSIYLWWVKMNMMNGCINAQVGPLLSGHILLSGHFPKSRTICHQHAVFYTSIQRPPLFSGRSHLFAVERSLFTAFLPLLSDYESSFQTKLWQEDDDINQKPYRSHKHCCSALTFHPTSQLPWACPSVGKAIYMLPDNSKKQ